MVFKMRNILVVLVLSLVSVFANAATGPLVYAQPPLFYSIFSPKVAPCAFNEEGKLGTCGWETWPEEINVFFTTREEPNTVWPAKVKGETEVICIDGGCTDQYGERRGHIDSVDGVSYWTLPIGYYLAELNGSISAVKYGNGPLKDTYPIKDVMVNEVTIKRIDGDMIDIKETEGIYNVYCSEKLTKCNYLGYEWTLSETSVLLPFVKTAYCDSFLCYIDQGLTKVAGINILRREEYIFK